MARCNELCTKDTAGTCALCEALAVRDRFERLWFRKEEFRRGFHLVQQWWYPVPRRDWEVRHQEVVREAHKQYSEVINKVMFTLLGVALFCLLTTIGSPDKLLLAGDSTIKVPFADTPLPFLGFIVVAPLLLIMLTIYLHVFYGYWLDCERERQYINQRLIPPIEGTPTLFSFPNTVPRVLTSFIFYWLVPLVLVTITWKAWALPAMGLPLTYVAGVVTFVVVLLQLRRRPEHQRQWWTLLDYTLLIVIVGLIVRATINPQSFQRPLNLFRAELPKAGLVGINMHRVSAGFAKLQGATLQGATLQGATLRGANLQRANLQRAQLQGAQLLEADLQEANLQGADLQGANLQGANLSIAENLTQGQINKACLDEQTKLPEKLTRPAPCPDVHKDSEPPGLPGSMP